MATTLVTEYNKDVYEQCLKIIARNGDLGLEWMRQNLSRVTWGSLNKADVGNVKTHAFCKTYETMHGNKYSGSGSGGRRRTRVKHNSKRKGSKSRNNRKSRKYSKRY
jgi:hypothetical protein